MESLASIDSSIDRLRAERDEALRQADALVAAARSTDRLALPNAIIAYDRWRGQR